MHISNTARVCGEARDIVSTMSTRKESIIPTMNLIHVDVGRPARAGKHTS